MDRRKIAIVALLVALTLGIGFLLVGQRGTGVPELTALRGADVFAVCQDEGLIIWAAYHDADGKPSVHGYPDFVALSYEDGRADAVKGTEFDFTKPFMVLDLRGSKSPDGMDSVLYVDYNGDRKPDAVYGPNKRPTGKEAVKVCQHAQRAVDARGGLQPLEPKK